MNKQDVIFLHGYGSGKNSSKYQILKSDPTLNVKIVEVDFDTVTWEEYVKAFLDCALDMYDPIVVGHSLGGFAARVLAYAYGLRTICYNPSPCPWETLPITSEFAHGLIRNVDFEYDDVPCIYLLEMGDEVLDHQRFIALDMYRNGEVIKIEGGHHRGQFIHMLPELVHRLANGIG